MIEDLKEEVSTFKGLKRKKTAPGYKGKDQEGKNKPSRELATSATKKDIRRMNVAVF